MRKVERSIVEAATVAQAGASSRASEVALADELLSKAAGFQSAIAKSFWELGKVLAEINEKKLHLALGIDRFETLVHERLGITRTLAWKLVAVASRLPRKHAVRLGQERAYALIAYASATPDAKDPAQLAEVDAVIVGDRPLSETPVRELLAARPLRPKSMAQRANAAADKKNAAALKRRLVALGVRGAEVAVDGDHVHITLSQSQAERLFGGD